ncbi:MAG: DUF503 domain-containing protein [Smithella sp.]|jgi:hypothetical protein
MVVGYGIINLRIPESGSLKNKRSVLNRILKRAQNKFNVSIAETGSLDKHKMAEIAFALVGNDSRYINGKVDQLLRFVENMQVAEILDSKTEIMVVSSFPEATDREINKYDEL